MPPKGPKGPPPKPGAKGPPAAMLAKMKAQIQAQRDLEERLKREEEEEERRLREEERLAEEERKREEDERREAKEAEKHQKKDDKKDRARERQLEAIERMRAAGYVVPDLTQKPAPLPKPAPKPKPKAKEATASPKEPVAVEPEETDGVSDDEPVNEVGDVDDWEEIEALEAERDAAVARNKARQERRDAFQAEKIAKKKAAEEEAKKAAEAKAKETASVLDLRSPICCVLGHVDTGKTSLLDRIRRTNVQGGEAGGITQQIGATFFPRDALVTATAEINKKYNHEVRVPGLLVIDTPGHESFTNLRSRGSTLCDIAILVVDVMHGLEPQTRESIRLLRERKCPFIVALNKMDRMLDWVPHENMDSEQTLEKQQAYVRNEFDTRTRDILTQFAEEGLNAELYWKNPDIRKYISVVPTSARTGEGVCDLLLLMMSLVQRFLEGKVTFKNDLQCTVLEVKPIQGIGMTIDVVLVNGVLHEGDTIVLCGLNGPIITEVRSLLTPQPLRELRVKSDYVHHKEIQAAMGVKIVAPNLDEVVPGTPMFVAKPGDDLKKLGAEVSKDMNSILGAVSKSGEGVTVQSSTLGALEALLVFLKESKIPVSAISLGPVHKRHLLHTVAMRQRSARYGVVLAFDVPVTAEAEEFAARNDVKIFSAKIIYHLFDRFQRHMEDVDKEEAERNRADAVFPVVIDQLQSINDRPMILSGHILEGRLLEGTPLCAVIEQETDGQKIMMKLPIGRVTGIQREGRDVKKATSGMSVAFKINEANSSLHFGRQFGEKHTLYSDISRKSIDAVKASFSHEMTPEDWDVMRKVRDTLGVKAAQ